MAKIGEGHMAGMGRMGLKELSQTLQAFPDSIKAPEEAGVFGNSTQAIITQQMGGVHGYNPTLDAGVTPMQQPEEVQAAPQVDQGYEARLAEAAARAPEQQQEQEMER